MQFFSGLFWGIDHSPSIFTTASAPRNAASSTVSSVAPVIPFTIASAATSSSISITDDDTFFDTSIANTDLIKITERASQIYQEERLRETNKVESNESGGSDSDADVNDRQSLANLTQSNNNSNNNNLNAVLARSFKSVNFDRLKNCTLGMCDICFDYQISIIIDYR